MDPCRLALAVTVDHECLGIVDEHGLRDATEVTERIYESLPPIVVVLGEKRLHMARCDLLDEILVMFASLHVREELGAGIA
jgi:hypothetical protein